MKTLFPLGPATPKPRAPRKPPRPMYYTLDKGWHLAWCRGDAEPFAFISRPRPQEGYDDWAYFGPTVAGNHSTYEGCVEAIDAEASEERDLMKQSPGQTTERKAG